MVDTSPRDRFSFRVDDRAHDVTALGKQKLVKRLTIQTSHCQEQP
jgi:hypothetical protein